MAIFEHKAVRPLEPSAPVLFDAIYNLSHPNYSTDLKVGRIEPVRQTSLLVDVERGVNKERAAVFGGPAAVLDILGTLRDQVGQKLADGQDFTEQPTICVTSLLVLED